MRNLKASPKARKEKSPVLLSSRFEDAMIYAAHIHAAHVRKGSGAPYLSHLLAVTAIALEHGANEDEAIAALLHDAVEDAGGKARLADIKARFGNRVAAIVAGCSDTDVTPKPPWSERKKAYVAHLRHAPPSVKLISAADKLHNARAILSDYRDIGEALWSRFKGGKPGTLWYYRAVLKNLTGPRLRRLATDIDAVITELEKLANAGRRVLAPPSITK